MNRNSEKCGRSRRCRRGRGPGRLGRERSELERWWAGPKLPKGGPTKITPATATPTAATFPSYRGTTESRQSMPRPPFQYILRCFWPQRILARVLLGSRSLFHEADSPSRTRGVFK